MIEIHQTLYKIKLCVLQWYFNGFQHMMASEEMKWLWGCKEVTKRRNTDLNINISKIEIKGIIKQRKDGKNNGRGR